MDKKTIDEFEKTHAQIEALHDEISLLSKKKPDDAINKFKLSFVNSVLEKANALLGQKYKPFSEFKVFDEDTLPTNSDVIMILGQYINCMEKLRSDNIKFDLGAWYWLVKGIRSGIETAPPKKLKER